MIRACSAQACLAPISTPAAQRGKENIMWYFTWILGVLLACSFGIINALWLETHQNLDEEVTGDQ